MVRSHAQKQASARTLLQNAIAQGLNDEAAIAWAVAAMGEENRALVQKVWDTHFKLYGPC